MLQCGLYELDITPALGLDMPGYFSRRQADGIKEYLYAFAAYFEDAQGKRSVLVSVDSEQIPKELSDSVRPAIARALEMDVAGVLVCATHIHTGGPVLDWDDFCRIDPVYLDFLHQRLLDVALLAQKEKRPVRLGFGYGHDDTLANYRNFIMADGSLRTNPAVGGEKQAFGKIDPQVGVLLINEPCGRHYGAVVNYSCHTDCVGGTEYSSDYPGAMRETLRKIYGQSFVPVFVNGFCGNLNHVDFEHASHAVPAYYRSMGRRLAAEAARTLEKIRTEETASLAMASTKITIPAAEPGKELLDWAENILETSEEQTVVDLHYAREALRLNKLGPRQIEICLQVIRIGELLIFASPREMYVEFQLMLKEKSPSSKTICISLANGPGGYVPIRELYKPGIYEARLTGDLMVPDAGYIMVDKLLELATSL